MFDFMLIFCVEELWLFIIVTSFVGTLFLLATCNQQASVLFRQRKKSSFLFLAQKPQGDVINGSKFATYRIAKTAYRTVLVVGCTVKT